VYASHSARQALPLTILLHVDVTPAAPARTIAANAYKDSAHLALLSIKVAGHIALV
jgi:hypothetical protein